MIEQEGESLERIARKTALLKQLTVGMKVGDKIIVSEPRGRHYVALYNAEQGKVRSGRSVMIRVDERAIGTY